MKFIINAALGLFISYYAISGTLANNIQKIDPLAELFIFIAGALIFIINLSVILKPKKYG